MMKTITDTAEITQTLSRYEATSQAEPTNRVIAGASSAMDPQEWAEYGEIDGAPAKVYYLFSQEEASDEDASNYPWDAEHIDRIEIAEKDEGGE